MATVSMIPKRFKWLSLMGFGGAAAGVAAAVLVRLFTDPQGAAVRNLISFSLVLAGYALGVAFAYAASQKQLLAYILRLREELRLSQDHLMEDAAFRSLGAYLDATAGTVAGLLRTMREDGKRLAAETSLTDAAREKADQVRSGCDSLETALGPLAGYALTRPARAPLSINTLMREAIDLCRHRAGEKKIVFSERYAVVPPVFGAAGRVQHALLNVVINAIEAMPHGGGTITIETAHADGKVLATVRDAGIGIRPEHQARIFDPFFTTKPERSSAGLGLWATREMLRPIDATIEVSSRPHEGTAVAMTFPAASPLRAGRTGTANPPELNRNTADEGDRRIA
jgi:signal transduction histidine kinase